MYYSENLIIHLKTIFILKNRDMYQIMNTQVKNDVYIFKNMFYQNILHQTLFRFKFFMC